MKNRVIPTLLYKNIGLVKGVGFDSWRIVDTVIPAIKVYNLREVDELILLDITATVEKKDPDYSAIKEFSKECFVPFTVGGGVRSVQHVKELLRAGADKVAINSSAYNNLNLIKESANKFGAQCIVASVDVKLHEDGNYYCYSENGTRFTGIEVVDWVKKLEANGAGEILITSIDRDGTMEGYDLILIKLVTSSISIPVIASGGAGEYQHMSDAIISGNASAVAAASMFHFTERTPKEAKKFLSHMGIPVRKK